MGIFLRTAINAEKTERYTHSIATARALSVTPLALAQQSLSSFIIIQSIEGVVSSGGVVSAGVQWPAKLASATRTLLNTRDTKLPM